MDDNVPDLEQKLARARTLLQRRGWQELYEQSQALRHSFPLEAEGFIFGAKALVGLAALDRAETLLEEGLRTSANNSLLLVEYAWLAHEKRDWQAARQRWAAVIDHSPANPIGYVGASLAEREMASFDAADARLLEAMRLFPDYMPARVEYAWVAHIRGDFAEARRRWAYNLTAFPNERQVYLGASATERSVKDYEAAEVLLSAAHKRFPDDEAVGLAYGWIATLRRDWATAFARWQVLVGRFPESKLISDGYRAAFGSAMIDERKGVNISIPGNILNRTGSTVGLLIQNGVLVGRDDELFLAEGGHAVLQFAMGERQVPEESFDNFLRNLLQRHKAVSATGGMYLHVIFPDKHSVCTERFPIADPVLLGMLYLERIPAIAHHICYPRDLLRHAPRPTYMRTDTHLNDYGTILAAAEIVRRLTGDQQNEHTQRLLGKVVVETEWSGDLGSKLSPPHSEKQLKSAIDWNHRWYNNNMTGGNNGIVDVYFTESPVFQKRLLWFGDSFGRASCQFMSYFFKEVVFFRTPFFHPDVVDQVKADYVVTQNVERYLNYVHSDEVRPSFWMYPYIGEHTYAPTSEFAAALSAALSYGRPPYRQFVDKLWVDERSSQ